jgi:hypothetical protein
MQTDFELLGARELDARTADGIDVRLLWREANDRVYVHVVDARTCEAFLVAVESAEALDAFRHPFAYASSSVPGQVLVLHNDKLGEEVAT